MPSNGMGLDEESAMVVLPRQPINGDPGGRPWPMPGHVLWRCFEDQPTVGVYDSITQGRRVEIAIPYREHYFFKQFNVNLQPDEHADGLRYDSCYITKTNFRTWWEASKHKTAGKYCCSVYIYIPVL